MGSKKSEQNSTTTTSVNSNESSYKTNFTSPESKQNYSNFNAAARRNYNNASDLTRNLYNLYQNGGIGDTSLFQQGWNGLTGIDQSNINKMNTQDLNPYNDEVTRNYIDASNRAAYLANGKNFNQALQNGIGSGMGGGSDHQTAMAKVGAQLAANINAQNQQTYLARQNQLEQNALAANGQLANFYNTLSNIGLDYARLGEQDLQTLLSAYSSMNDALKSWGSAVEMGSDPTVTTSGEQNGYSHTNTTSSSGGGLLGGLGSALGLLTPAKWFG